MNEPKITMVITEDSCSLTFEVDGRTLTRTYKKESSGLMRSESNGNWFSELKKILKNKELIQELGESIEQTHHIGVEASHAIQFFGENYSRLDDLRPLKKDQ